MWRLPPHEIRLAPAPKETSPHTDNQLLMDSLTSLMERMSISITEMANKDARMEELTAQVNKMSLNMTNLGGPQMYSNSAYLQQYGQGQRYGPNYGPNHGPHHSGQFNNNLVRLPIDNTHNGRITQMPAQYVSKTPTGEMTVPPSATKSKKELSTSRMTKKYIWAALETEWLISRDIEQSLRRLWINTTKLPHPPL